MAFLRKSTQNEVLSLTLLINDSKGDLFQGEIRRKIRYWYAARWRYRNSQNDPSVSRGAKPH